MFIMNGSNIKYYFLHVVISMIEAFNVGKEQLVSSKILFEAEQYRDSIALSYYAMHSSASALLLKKNISPNTHGGALRQLGKEYVNEGLFSKEIYNYFYDAKRYGNDALYDYSAIFSEELAEELILHAEEFLAEVERLL